MGEGRRHRGLCTGEEEEGRDGHSKVRTKDDVENILRDRSLDAGEALAVDEGVIDRWLVKEESDCLKMTMAPSARQQARPGDSLVALSRLPRKALAACKQAAIRYG